MGLQKMVNKWFIKKTIGSDYVYELEAEEKVDLMVKQKLAEDSADPAKEGLDEIKEETQKGLGE